MIEDLYDINIKVPSVDVLWNVLSSYFNVTSIKEYYFAKPDDDFVGVDFFPNEEHQNPTTMKILINTIRTSLLPYLEYVSKKCNQGLEMDVRVYDFERNPCYWLGHFLYTHDAKYEVFDQKDYEKIIFDDECDTGKYGQLDEYEVVLNRFNWDDQRAYKVNLDEEDAPMEYGDKLVFPAEYIPNDIKKELEHDPVAFKIKLEEIVQEKLAIKEEERKRVLLNTTTIQEDDLPF